MSIQLRHHLVVLAALLVSALASSPLARASDPPISLDAAYQQIKGAEGKIPVPTPEATVDVGYFNAATGEFDGDTTDFEIINGKPVRMVPHEWVNAVNTRLLFHVYNATKSVRVSVAGAGSATVGAGGTTLAVHAGRSHDLRWTITSGLKRYGDELIIDRPRMIGAGAFTIPALPVAVVYDPPQNSAGTNSDVYTRSTSIGVSLGMNFDSSSSTSTAGSPPQFADLTMFHQQLQAAQAFETLVGQSTAATAFGDIDKYLGSATRNVATKNDNAGTSKRAYTFTDQRGCAIDAGIQHVGPGRSDMIAYLRNARMVWLDNGATTYLQLLGYGQFECATIDQLRGGLTQLNPTTVNSLVALDPFATNGPKAQLALDPRFVSMPGIGLLPGIVQTATFTQQLLVDNTSSSAYTRTVTDDLGAGLLSLVGLAPSQSQQIVTTMSVGTTLETTDTTTASVALTARTLTDGIRTELSVFYDSVFGTVAFQDSRP
jgi:hypothetical protein